MHFQELFLHRELVCIYFTERKSLLKKIKIDMSSCLFARKWRFTLVSSGCLKLCTVKMYNAILRLLGTHFLVVLFSSWIIRFWKGLQGNQKTRWICGRWYVPARPGWRKPFQCIPSLLWHDVLRWRMDHVLHYRWIRQT